MTVQEYQKFCSKGVITPNVEVNEGLIFGLGLAGESGEVCDILKKHFGHNKPLDYAHLAEELGDVLWYIANLCNEFHLDMEMVMLNNVNKLLLRYPDMYLKGETK